MPSVIFTFIFLLITCTATIIRSEDEQQQQLYIVYTGGRSSSKKLTVPLSEKQSKEVVHVYEHGFTGFSVYMSQGEADRVAQVPGVVSVFPDRMLRLHTTRSWSFLKHQQPLATSTMGTHTTRGADVIIGVIDTGEFIFMSAVIICCYVFIIFRI